MKEKIDNKTNAEKFYLDVLKEIKKSEIPYLIGGTYALREYTGIQRATKDLDVFCRAVDHIRILKILSEKGYRTEITDDRWLAKIFNKNDHLIDLIFGSRTSIQSVDESWLRHGRTIQLFGITVKITSPEDLVWSKAFREERNKFDGADIDHIFLKQGRNINWKQMLSRFAQHWELFLSRVIHFRYVYPSERSLVPRWLIEELLNRLKDQLEAPIPNDKVSRGPLLSAEYAIDFSELGFKSIT